MGAKVVALESDAGAAAAARAELAGRTEHCGRRGPSRHRGGRAWAFRPHRRGGSFPSLPGKPDCAARRSRDASSGSMRQPGASQAVLYEKSGGALGRRALFETRADTLDGFQPGVSFAF